MFRLTVILQLTFQLKLLRVCMVDAAVTWILWAMVPPLTPALSVPPFSVIVRVPLGPLVTVLPAVAGVELAATFSAPEFTATPPLKVLDPLLKVSVPAPPLVTAPAPDMAPDKVCAAELL